MARAVVAGPRPPGGAAHAQATRLESPVHPVHRHPRRRPADGHLHRRLRASSGDIGRPDLLETAAGVAGGEEIKARAIEFHSIQRLKAFPGHPARAGRPRPPAAPAARRWARSPPARSATRSLFNRGLPVQRRGALLRVGGSPAAASRRRRAMPAR
jgi:hypothetical protein